jgi:hypothetical protein
MYSLLAVSVYVLWRYSVSISSSSEEAEGGQDEAEEEAF